MNYYENKALICMSRRLKLYVINGLALYLLMVLFMAYVDYKIQVNEDVLLSMARSSYIIGCNDGFVPMGTPSYDTMRLECRIRGNIYRKELERLLILK
jgi:hypothetical protein